MACTKSSANDDPPPWQIPPKHLTNLDDLCVWKGKKDHNNCNAKDAKQALKEYNPHAYNFSGTKGKKDMSPFSASLLLLLQEIQLQIWLNQTMHWNPITFLMLLAFSN